MNKPNVGILLLRLGLAFSFLYAGTSSLMSPNDWVGYLPAFIPQVHRLDLLKLFSVYEIGLGLWLLTGRYVKYAALLAALTLAGVVVVNLSVFSVTFRDVSLIFAALALFFISDRK